MTTCVADSIDLSAWSCDELYIECWGMVAI